MQVQGSGESFAEAIERNLFLGFLLIGARSKTAINGFVRVQEKGGEGQVVIELEEGEVHGVSLNQPDANELVQQLLQPRIVTNNLFVESSASLSGDAAKHHQQGLAGALRFTEAFRQIVIDPFARGQHITAVVDDLGVAILSGDNKRGEKKGEYPCVSKHEQTDERG
jgi:hypothetical protein